jgi:hypothetical protein
MRDGFADGSICCAVPDSRSILATSSPARPAGRPKPAAVEPPAADAASSSSA